jgi:pyridoxine/pyridoxamine 5'-phosphate oxidase
VAQHFKGDFFSILCTLFNTASSTATQIPQAKTVPTKEDNQGTVSNRTICDKKGLSCFCVEILVT